MKTLAIAAGLALFGAAATASADYYIYRDAPPPATVYREAPPATVVTTGDQECWNGHARHFERVRPGDYQPDLDFSRCRAIGAPVYVERERVVADECWNPRAGHFEAVRPNEAQNDLDFSRCRHIAEGAYYGRGYR